MQETVAINSMSPLRQYGISYFNPQTTHWSPLMLPVEMRTKEHAHILLYVITGETLGIGSLTEVPWRFL